MIILAPLCFTDSGPITDPAMLHRFRISLDLSLLCGDKVRLDLPKESEISLNKKLFWLRPTSKHHMHVLRHNTLNFRKQVGVETQLNNRPRLRRPRELCLHYFIRKRSQLTRSLHLPQKIGPPIPVSDEL